MVEENGTHKEFRTCFENLPFAEMMREMTKRQRIGSLCAEMIKKMMQKGENGCSFNCSEMMQEMMKRCSKIKEESQKWKEEVRHGRKE